MGALIDRLPEACRRYWIEIWGRGDMQVVDEVFADPIVRHHGSGTETTSRAEYRKRMGEIQRVLHKPETTIDDCVIDGDHVWVRATSRGLNKELGEMSTMTWLVIQRLEDGRIVEQWTLTTNDVDWRTSPG